MNRKGFLTEFTSLVGFSVLVVIFPAVTALAQIAGSLPDETDKQQVVQRIAQEWIQVAQKQYQRNEFRFAELSLGEALEYNQFLSQKQLNRIIQLRDEVYAAIPAKKELAKHIQIAEQLIERQELIKAKAHLNKVINSPALSKNERQKVADMLKSLGRQIEQKKKELTELYDNSVRLYRAGQLEAARQGFIKVAANGLLTLPASKRPEDYLLKIDKALGTQLKGQFLYQRNSADIETDISSKDIVAEIEDESLYSKIEPGHDDQFVIMTTEPVTNETVVLEVATPLKQQNNSLENANHKNKVRQGYARAVVADAFGKAQKRLEEGKFYWAQKALTEAQQVLMDNQKYMGIKLITSYKEAVIQIKAEIQKGRAQWLGSENG